MTREGIKGILDKHGGDRFGLIAILEDIQHKYGHLSEDSLRTVAEKTGRDLNDVYAVATFYRAFSLKPRGKHICQVCLGTACHVRGAQIIVEEMQRQLGVNAGETTPDDEVTLETVACVGACALGPIVVIDGGYVAKVNTEKVKRIIDKARSGEAGPVNMAERPTFPLKVNCPRCNHSLMDAQHHLDGHPSIRVTMAVGENHGWLRLSSVYGSYALEAEHDAPLETIIDIFCPHCHGQLTSATNCTECGAHMVPLIVRGGGIIQICARRGCKAHMLDLDGANI
ncbi:MAG: NAD(P)H-dependent oxidoreductase subunit E [Candidatus Riflebacteria bacterium]|nr:NAD(P)H-dependent oxidoreductase subunit E [Candidatus Riflebacteria bacterium]